MPKKIIGYIVIGLVVIAVLVLVHFVLTNGYSGKSVTTATVTPSAAPTGSSESAQTVGTTVSDKISLVVTSPKDGDTLGSTNVTVKGKTSPNADIFVNDQSGKADVNGNFSISVGLDEGSNVIVVSANDSLGNATEQDLTVTVASFQ